ncbi:hypothetical protein KPH14_003460 [Odynerus spinipes]|uniref:Uncharacterized protein n=1 Tax=Odynerus spinipes TaxID=1348599 RepID=A0AAD9RCP5_9HYME|nr:hypothetical protein KPH14_003460 [Odynerus spinipes]
MYFVDNCSTTCPMSLTQYFHVASKEANRKNFGPGDAMRSLETVSLKERRAPYRKDLGSFTATSKYQQEARLDLC